MLQIKRQRLNAIVKSGRLVPLKFNNYKCCLFLRTDVDKYILGKKERLMRDVKVLDEMASQLRE